MEVTARQDKEHCILAVSGKIDSGNSKDFEEQTAALLTGSNPVFDLQKLEYISSAGLRVILSVRKKYPTLEIINASPAVYEVLDMTGFTEMMKISRAMRELTLDGAQAIGVGANGTVYRMNDDTVVKVYKSPCSLEEIQHEREVAREALVLGIPTAISYDMVKVGDCYATVFEMIDAKSLSALLRENPGRIDEYVDKYVSLLKLIHGTEVPEDTFPDGKKIFMGYVHFLKNSLPSNDYCKLVDLAESIPESNHMIHADFHTKNLLMQDGEMILIDMDTIATGVPLLEFGYIYNAFQGYFLYNRGECMDFLGIPYELATEFYRKVVKKYFCDMSDEERARMENKTRVIGLTRVYRKKIQRKVSEREQSCFHDALIEAIGKVDSLA